MENIIEYLSEEALEKISSKYYDEARLRHVRQVTDLSLKIFDLLQESFHLSQEEKNLLEYSASLHDIGYYINETKHEKHTRYIIRNDSLFEGVPDNLRSMLSLIAGGHRSSIDRIIRNHAKEEQREVLQLTAILRIGDALDYLHESALDVVDIRWIGDDLVLVLSGSDLKAVLQKLQQKSLLFRKVYNQKLLFTLEETPAV